MKKTIGTTILATTLALGLFAAEANVANNELTAESKANFEENRFHNSLARAKEQGKKSWEDAKMNPSERTKKMQEEREAKLKEAQERKAAAEERYEKAKKN